MLAQYFILQRAFALVMHTTHRLLVRARTDITFDAPVPLQLHTPGAIHLEAGRFELRPSERAAYGAAALPPGCGWMPNDLFAYGERKEMLAYSQLLAAVSEWYPRMRHEPSLRDWRKSPFARENGTFLGNQEGMLGVQPTPLARRSTCHP